MMNELLGIRIDSMDIGPVLVNPPAGLVCSLTNGTFTASWNAVTGTTQYRCHLYENPPDCNTASSGWIDEQFPTTTSYTKTGLTGTKYCVHVRAWLPIQSNSVPCSSADIPPPLTKWKCTDPTTNTCTLTIDGTYDTEAACKAAAECTVTPPKGCIDINTILMVAVAGLVGYLLFFKKS